MQYIPREILFKAKTITNNAEWVEGYYSKAPHFISGALDHYISYPSFNQNKVYVIDPNTLCQYTGLDVFFEDLLLNENEYKLYEHDIIEIDYDNKKILAEVRYENGMYILCSNDFIDGYIPLFDLVVLEEGPYVNARIIGNSIDNSQLLENPILYTVVGYSEIDDVFVPLENTFIENYALNQADYFSIRCQEAAVIRQGHIISDIEVRIHYNKDNEEIIYSSMLNKESTLEL